MTAIADAAWETDRDRLSDPLLVKANVQKWIFDIRGKLGRSVIASSGSTYKVQLAAAEAALGRRLETVPERERSSAQFEDEIREILVRARDSFSISRLYLWGSRSVMAIRAAREVLLEAISEHKRISLFMSDGTLAVELLAELIREVEVDTDAFVQMCGDRFQLAVVDELLGTGLAWVDHRPAESFVRIVGSAGGSCLLETGLATVGYMVPLESAMSRLRAASATPYPLILVDSTNGRDDLDSQLSQMLTAKLSGLTAEGSGRIVGGKPRTARSR